MNFRLPDSGDYHVPEIRPANLGDAVALEALLGRSTRYVLPSFAGPLTEPLAISHLASLERMLIFDGTFLVVEVGGVPLACGGWSRRDRDPGAVSASESGARLLDPASEAARVLSLAVRKDWTGRGLAEGILEECAEVARDEGYRRLAMMATTEAVTLSIRCGFREIGRISMDLAGTPVEAVSMERRIG